MNADWTVCDDLQEGKERLKRKDISHDEEEMQGITQRFASSEVKKLFGRSFV